MNELTIYLGCAGFVMGIVALADLLREPPSERGLGVIVGGMATSLGLAMIIVTSIRLMKGA